MIDDKNETTLGRLCKSLDRFYPGRVTPSSPRRVADFDIVVNATSMGLRVDDPSPSIWKASGPGR
jgi:shikimate 5-dehydrogenase